MFDAQVWWFYENGVYVAFFRSRWVHGYVTTQLKLAIISIEDEWSQIGIL